MISFGDIKPFIRYAQRLTVTKKSNFLSQTAYDNRFFYCIGGSGSVKIDGQNYPLQKGTLMLWRSGIKYDIFCENEMELVGFNFDYTQQNAHLSAPIPPARNDFDETAVLEHFSFGDTPCLNGVVYLNNMHLVEKQAVAIFEEYRRRLSLFETKTSALFVSLLTDIVRESALDSDNIRRSKSKVEEILIYISEHYSEEITNTALGEIFSYHPNYINHLVVQHTGMSLHKYLLSYRINRAIDLLQSTDLTVVMIAEKVGFTDYNHFLKYFKQVTGRNTKDFRPFL